ncbi:MAG: GNAT family N-acetyltransferase [Oscillospiraceae bacterium]|nr:GNAT family N-acetyltransferase [Oscillospiraceae bacterium]
MPAIRPAKKEDIPRILELLIQVDMVHHRIRPDLFNGPVTKYSESELGAILSDETTPVFVFPDEDGRVLGYVFCVLKEQHGPLLTEMKTLYIDDLCVDEAARGRHVGTALYDYACAYARQLGCYNVTLNVWEGNDAARQFYEKMGMKPQKTGMETIL